MISVYRVLIHGALKDAVTGQLLRMPFTVQTDRAGVQAKVADEGLFCLAGVAEQVFPEHATQAYNVDVVVHAAGYRDATFTVTVPMAAAYPIGLPDTTLSPHPVSLVGRATSNSGSQLPVANARVVLVDTLPQHPVALRTPLRFSHGAGVTVQARTLNAAPLVGPAKQLAEPARSGSPVLMLNNRQGLVAGQIVQIGAARLLEHGLIVNVPATPADLTLPGTIILRDELVRSAPAGAPVQLFTPGGVVGPSRHLVHAADAGDGMLLLDGVLGAIPASAVIEVVDGLQIEYRAPDVLTDADGYYRLDGVGHVASLRAQCSQGASTSPVLTCVIDYAQPNNELSFQLSP